MGRTAFVAPFVLLALAGIAGTSSAALTREPELVVPADLTVEAQGPSGATVTFSASARGRDNASLPVDCRPASGTRFPLGKTTVTCTAQDRPDEIAIRSFRVAVVDRTAPKLIVPADIRVRTKNRKGAAVTFRASAIDLVDGQVVPVCSPRSSTLFRIGTTRVVCTATDRAENLGSASFTVTVSRSRRTRQAALYSPAAGDVLSTPPLLAWRRVPRATYYHIQLFRNGNKILSAWPSRPRLQLHHRWIHRGRRMNLTPGTYVWFIWPGFGDLARAQYGPRLGRSTFRMA
jgi:HYR domain